MKTLNSTHLILSIIIMLFSCSSAKKEDPLQAEPHSSSLQLDHFNIWVKNPQQAKQELINLGFTAVPDSLSSIHTGQGTAGKYFYFLNTYLELIFVRDQREFETNNMENKNLDFAERANFDSTGALPFSIALKLSEYDSTKIPFQKVQYLQDWMAENESIYSAKNSKTNLKEPSIFVVYPELESQQFETMDDLNSIPEKYAFVRSFYKHPNGAKRITQITITSNDVDLQTKTMTAMNEIKNITVQKGQKQLMELYLDNQIQGKSFDLRPNLPLIVYL